MADPLVPAAALGLVLGLRHAFDPDHLAAVSTLATRQGRLRDGALLGLAWGAGHTITVGFVALGVTLTGVHVPEALEAAAELLVAALLVLLGLPVVLRYARGRWHMHQHAHEGAAPHFHLHSHAAGGSHAHTHGSWDARRSLGLGLAHGLAGSAALAVLLVATVATPGARLACVLAFGVGSTGAMLGVSLALTAAARWAARGGARLATALHLGAAAASVLVGATLAWETLAR